MSAPDLIGSMSGESEQRIVQLFDAACEATMSSSSPDSSGCAAAMIFIDNLDVIAGKKEVCGL